MRKLIICETPFQIIVSLIIKQQFTKSNDELDLVVTDTFSGSDRILDKIKEEKKFNNVYFVPIKDIILSKTIMQKIKKLIFVLFPSIMLKKRWMKEIKYYDEIYIGNYDLYTSSLRSFYAFRNYYPKVFMYEEAYISYFPIDEMYPIFGFMKFIEWRNKILGKEKITRSNLDGWLLFEPNKLLYNPKCSVFKLDREICHDPSFIKTVDHIFSVSKVLKNYDRKYIIFEEAVLANNKDIDDERVFDEIVKIVGRDNAIIKLHPRTSEDRFSKKKIKTLKSDGVPWEALALVGDFSDKVLIAISSSAIPTYKMLIEDKMNAYMLFKFIKTDFKQFAAKYDKFWDKMGILTKNGGIHIPNTEEEFLNDLKKEVDRNEK